MLLSATAGTGNQIPVAGMIANPSPSSFKRRKGVENFSFNNLRSIFVCKLFIHGGLFNLSFQSKVIQKLVVSVEFPNDVLV